MTIGQPTVRNQFKIGDYVRIIDSEECAQSMRDVPVPDGFIQASLGKSFYVENVNDNYVRIEGWWLRSNCCEPDAGCDLIIPVKCSRVLTGLVCKGDVLVFTDFDGKDIDIAFANGLIGENIENLGYMRVKIYRPVTPILQ